MAYNQIKSIMGKNFIGPEELNKISGKLKINNPLKLDNLIPPIPFKLDFLIKISQDYILILGIPKDKNNRKLTINRMRLMFGWNPNKSEPCFYNQDWYLKEKFANKITLNLRWYLMKKTVKPESRGKNPETILKKLNREENFPSAILATFVFFSFYLLNNEILWKHDYIWCSDKDLNSDRIYIGRYLDPKIINKNGINIHRYLTINSFYGLCPQYKK